MNVTARAIAEATAPAAPLVVQHLAKSYEVGGRMVPVIGDLSLTLDNSQIVSLLLKHRHLTQNAQNRDSEFNGLP